MCYGRPYWSLPIHNFSVVLKRGRDMARNSNDVFKKFSHLFVKSDVDSVSINVFLIAPPRAENLPSFDNKKLKGGCLDRKRELL